MSEQESKAAIEALFDRWFRQVSSEGQLDLVPSCIAPVYTQHLGALERQVTPEEMARELAALRPEQKSRFQWHDIAIVGDRLWVRFTRHGVDASVPPEAALAVYRIENGKFAEIWRAGNGPGSLWPEDKEAST